MAWLNVWHASVRPSSLRICQPCSTFDYCVRRWLGESSVNYYDVLGLRPNASQSQIKTAYYQLSKLYHPDTAKNLPNSKEMFARLSVAYEVLGNPHKRALYDREHHARASFRSVTDDDIKYRDFLRRRGSFSPRHSASATSARKPGLEFDEFYKKHYGKSLRHNWEAKKSTDYKQQGMKQTQEPPESSNGSAMLGIVITACMMIAFFFIK